MPPSSRHCLCGVLKYENAAFGDAFCLATHPNYSDSIVAQGDCLRRQLVINNFAAYNSHVVRVKELEAVLRWVAIPTIPGEKTCVWCGSHHDLEDPAKDEDMSCPVRKVLQATP